VDIYGTTTNATVLMLYVIPEMPIYIGFLEGPMRSPKTGELISFSDYVKEIYKFMKSNSEKIDKSKK